MNETIEPIKAEIKRDEAGRIVAGSGPLNPAGRPKGPTLKEWVRNRLMSMTDEERVEFLKNVPLDIQWKMAEGMPQTNTDITSGGKPLILPAELINKNDTPHNTEVSS
jgi:hypothetical protein